MMGERLKSTTGNCSGAGVEDRVSEWEVGLPTAEDLTPLSQSLIPPELASAFRISPEPSRSMLDVNCASQNTLSSLLATGKCGGGGSQGSNKFKLFHDETSGTTTTTGTIDGAIMDIDDVDLTREGSDSRKVRRVTIGGGGGGAVGSAEEIDSETNNNNNNNDNNINNNSNENGGGGDDCSAKTLKRPRLVWTPQLHKRFVDVVAHLGIKNAVPKTIMQLMNVEGLTRENVASHLQKYRLYVKRMQGLSTEGPSSSDHLFASTPVPHSLHESGSGSGSGNGNESGGGGGNGASNNGYIGMPFPVPYPHPHPNPSPTAAAQMVPVPVIQMAGPTPAGFYDSHHQYGVVQQQMDWPGNQFGSVVPHHYYHVAPNDK